MKTLTSFAAWTFLGFVAAEPPATPKPAPGLGELAKPLAASRGQAASLDGWERAQTKPMLKEFTQHIQPILVNGCGTGACHGGDQPRGAFVLQRAPGNSQFTPQHTLRNLGQAVSLLNKQSPRESVLLKKALEAHGGGERAPFGGPDAPAYRTLEAWIRQVAPAPTESAPAHMAAEPRTPAGDGTSGFAGDRPAEPSGWAPKSDEGKAGELTKEEALRQLLERKTASATPLLPGAPPTVAPLPGQEELDKLKGQSTEGLKQSGAPPMLAGGQEVGRPATPTAPQLEEKRPAAPIVGESGDPYDPTPFNEWARKKK